MSTRQTVIIDMLNIAPAHKDFNMNAVLKKIDDGIVPCCIFDEGTDYIFDLEKIVKYKVKLIKPHSFFYRWVKINFLAIGLLIKYSKSKLIFLHLPPLTILVLCYFDKFFSKCSIEVYLHGELMYLTKVRGLGQQIGAIFLRHILRERKSNVKKYCITKSIYQSLSNTVDINEMLVTYTSYDVNYGEPIVHEYTSSDKIIFTAGVIGEAKGTLYVNNFCQNLKTLKKFTIIVDGKTDGTLSLDDFNTKISVTLRNDLLPEEHFVKRFQSADFIFIPQLFLDEYELVYSGLLETCLNFCVPIITKKTPFLADIERNFGPIGVLLDNACQIDEFPFAEIKEKEFENFRQNMLKFRG